MNMLLVNIENNINKVELINIYSKFINEIDDTIYIYVLNIDNEYVNKILKYKNKKYANKFMKIISNFKNKFIQKTLNKSILKLTNKNKTPIYYIFNEEAKTKLINGSFAQLKEILEKQNLFEYSPKFNIIDNILFYLKDYVKNNKISKNTYDLKCIYICNKYTFNKNKLYNFVNEFKTIDIYSKTKVKTYDVSKISKFNDNEGTSISVINNTVKNMKQYDVVLYENMIEKDLYSLRFKDNILTINLNDIKKDYLNKKYIYVKDNLLRQEDISNIEKLCKDFDKSYGIIRFSNYLYDLTKNTF